MSRKRNTIFALLICGMLVLSVTGCGKKKASTTTTTTTAAAVTADTTATETTAMDTTVTDTTATDTTATDTTATDTTTTGTSTEALAGLANVANCKQLSDLGTAFASAFTGANGDTQKEAQLLKEFADKTPEDIRPDFETLAAAFSKIADALKGVDLSSGKTPSPDVIAKLAKLSNEFNSAELTKAEANISAWATKNCAPNP